MIRWPSWSTLIGSSAEQKTVLREIVEVQPRTRRPKGRQADVAACDLPDERAAPERIAGRELYIVYRSSNGTMTERSITIRKLVRANQPDGSCFAFCHERRALRQFRIDRIEECIDPDTGEDLDPARFFAQLVHAPWQVDRADLEDFTRVLVFMAYCDGAIVAEEEGAITDALSRFVLRCDGTDQDFEQACAFARRAAIEGIDFLAAMRRLIRHPDSRRIARLTIDNVEAVIHADFHLHDDETRWQGQVLKTMHKVAVL